MRVVCWPAKGDVLSGGADLLALEETCFVCKVDLEMEPRYRTSYPFSTWSQSATRGCQNCDQICRSIRIFADTYDLDVDVFHIATLSVHYNRSDFWIFNHYDDDTPGCQRILVGIFWVSAVGDMSEHLQFRRYGNNSPHLTVENSTLEYIVKAKPRRCDGLCCA